MPRRPRVFVDDGIYRVYSRFARAEDVLADPEETVEFSELLWEVKAIRRTNCSGASDAPVSSHRTRRRPASRRGERRRATRSGQRSRLRGARSGQRGSALWMVIGCLQHGLAIRRTNCGGASDAPSSIVASRRTRQLSSELISLRRSFAGAWMGHHEVGTRGWRWEAGAI